MITVEVDFYKALLAAGVIDDGTDLEGFDEPAWIEGHDGYPDLLNDMREEDVRCSSNRSES